MATNVYDLGGGKFQIVAVYKGQRTDRKIQSTGIKDAAKEQRKLQEQFEADVDAGRIDPRKTAPLLWQFCAVKNLDADPPVREHGAYHLHILNRNRIGEYTYKNRLYTLATLIEHLGHLHLDEFGPEHILEYQDVRSGEGALASTINSETNVLRGIISLAAVRRIEGVKLLTKKLAPDLDETETEAVPWTTQEMANLLEASWRRSRRLHGIVLTLANTGMRRGEAIHLQWSGVDFETNTITLRPSRWWKPKDKQPRRVPMPPALAEYLQSMRRESTFVFVSRRGEPFAFWPQLQFDEARETAGLTGGPHRLRHTYASHFLANWVDRAGDPMMLLAQVLGHSRAQMTRRYSHFLPGHLDAARGLVNFGGDTAAQTKARGAWLAGGVKRRPKK